MHQLPKLNYEYNQLEPYIDTQTMELHYSKHHQTYVDKLNAAISGTEWQDMPIQQLLQQISDLPDELQTAVRNNGGGHYNHTLFWQCMTPGGKALPATLTSKINTDFGSVEEFMKQFADAAVARFGSGWVWLTKNTGGQLEISSTPNQDSPIMNGVQPLLGLDVWEHAYYLKYQNRRPEYVENFWKVVDWEFVAGRL